MFRLIKFPAFLDRSTQKQEIFSFYFKGSKVSQKLSTASPFQSLKERISGGKKKIEKVAVFRDHYLSAVPPLFPIGFQKSEKNN